MMTITGIYKITAPDGMIYIGQSVDIPRRWLKYSANNCRSQRRLNASFKSHGVQSHRFEIICQCDKSELNNLEYFYIKLHKSTDPVFGLNLKTGGQGGQLSEETKTKIGNANRGRKISQDVRDRWSAQRKGKPSGNKGKIASLELRIKLAAAHLSITDSRELDKIRELSKFGVTQRVLAEKYNVDRSTISNIVNFKNGYRDKKWQ